MRRTVQDVMTREVVAVRSPTPFKEPVLAVESKLRWQAEDAADQVLSSEPAPMG